MKKEIEKLRKSEYYIDCLCDRELENKCLGYNDAIDDVLRLVKKNDKLIKNLGKALDNFIYHKCILYGEKCPSNVINCHTCNERKFIKLLEKIKEVL